MMSISTSPRISVDLAWCLLRGRVPARLRRGTIPASASFVFLMSSSDPVVSRFTPSYHLVAPVLSLSSGVTKNGSVVLFAAEIESLTRSKFFVVHCAALDEII